MFYLLFDVVGDNGNTTRYRVPCDNAEQARAITYSGLNRASDVTCSKIVAAPLPAIDLERAEISVSQLCWWIAGAQQKAKMGA